MTLYTLSLRKSWTSTVRPSAVRSTTAFFTPSYPDASARNTSPSRSDGDRSVRRSVILTSSKSVNSNSSPMSTSPTEAVPAARFTRRSVPSSPSAGADVDSKRGFAPRATIVEAPEEATGARRSTDMLLPHAVQDTSSPATNVADRRTRARSAFKTAFLLIASSFFFRTLKTNGQPHDLPNASDDIIPHNLHCGQGR